MQFFYEKQVNIFKILTKQCPKNMSGKAIKDITETRFKNNTNISSN